MGVRRSLRRRLTVFYTAVGGLTLGTAGVAVTVGAFAVLTRPRAISLAQAADGVTATAALAPAHEATLALQHRIVREEGRKGIRLIALPGETIRAGPPTHPPGELSVAALFGLYRRFIRVRDGVILVVSEPVEVEALVRTFSAIVLAVGVSSLILAWLIARIVTRKTLAPLLTVTAELKRFASGDFSPRPLTISDATELGDLADAYNGAARQVTEAFLERARTEEQIRAFVAEAGHELRTPLTVVAGYIDGLRRAGNANDAYRHTAFAALAIELRRMRALVERLMTLARLDSRLAPRCEVIDIGAIVAQAVESLAITTDISIGLTKESDLFVFGEPGDVYEAVSNLIENAIKYGGRSAIAVTSESTGDDVRVRVVDGGPGIAQSDRQRIFERFYRGAQTDSVGSGLGLPIVVKAAERLGGRLALEDAGPGSTTFALYMPAFTDGGAEAGVDAAVLAKPR